MRETGFSMAVRLETERLLLRPFTPGDLEALHQLLSDEVVNRFLPWFPPKDLEETMALYEARFSGGEYQLAICRKPEDRPIGYLTADTGESHDLGYALKRELWHMGIVTEAAQALIRRLRSDGVPYITATHDRDNPRSGGVMARLGMKYCYSYEEQWQPKDFPVIFRMYQLNLDGQEERVYRRYWDTSKHHFVEHIG